MSASITASKLLDRLVDPGAFTVGTLPPRAPSWPSKRMEIAPDEWLFNIGDWRMDISPGWRWTWRPEADFPPQLDGFESPDFDDSGWASIDLPATFEAEGCIYRMNGADFKTVNLAAPCRGPAASRPTSRTDLGFGYFDTDLNRMVWRTETGWSD